MAKKKDTYSYRGWLNSDYFLKRTLAIQGYSMVAFIIIYCSLVFLIVMLDSAGLFIRPL